jgi:dienelactone hydrolase
MTTLPRNHARWIAALLLGLALALYLVRVDLVEIIVSLAVAPLRRVVLALALASAAMAALAVMVDRRVRATPARQARSGACLVIAVLLAGWVSATDMRAHRELPVSFVAHGVRLAGTLYLPRNASGPVPAAVIVQGSGRFKRRLYDVWARRVVRMGVGVLLLDKRGVGASGGAYESENNTSRANLRQLAEDAAAAVDYLATRAEVRPESIGLLGLSQGGWVAPLAATLTPHAAWIALISGPAVSVAEEGAWSELRGDDERTASKSLTEAERIVDTVTSRGFDPRPILGALELPALWMFGDADNSIPSAKSLRVLDSLAALGHAYTCIELAGYGHVLVGRGNGRIPHFAPESWKLLESWLATVTVPAASRASPPRGCHRG